ncbi:MAG: hypothetical protein KIH69_015360 [Anaerolineae bacterium]|nr:hypothetical protein [Anaerolineae bacterium]
MLSDILNSIDEFSNKPVDTNIDTNVYDKGKLIEKRKLVSSKHFHEAVQKLLTLRIKPPSGANTLLSAVNDSYSKISLECMMNNLECFSEMLIATFCDPLYLGEPDGVIRYHSNTLTREFALNAILQQTEIDGMAISQIIKDRDSNSTILGAVKALDKAANQMIQSAVTAGFFDENPNYVLTTPIDHTDLKGPTREPRPTPLVYFSGGAKTRMIPYCPVAPLSLPLNLIAKDPFNSTDLEIWLKPALAYEVGRLIFWKGSVFSDHPNYYFKRNKFARNLHFELLEKGRSKWVANAVSGIFADIFMTIQCRLNAFGHALRRAQPRSLDRFHGEELRYQLPPLLRPQVVIKTLELLGINDLEKDELSNRLIPKWTEIQQTVYGRTQREVDFNGENERDLGLELPIETTVYTETGAITMSVVAAKTEVDLAVEYIFNAYFKNLTLSGNSALELDKISSASPPSAPNWNYGNWQSGDIWMKNVPIYEGYDLNKPVQSHFMLENWFSVLSVETRNSLWHAYKTGLISKPIFDEHFRGQRYYWVTALYTGGWTMESPGNTGQPY